MNFLFTAFKLNLSTPSNVVFSLIFLYLASAIQLFYSVRNMFELYCNVVPTYHQQHLVSKKVSSWPQNKM